MSWKRSDLGLFLSFLACAAALAQAPAGPNRPIGVPDDYVITPSGYFHASCVREVEEGGTLLENGPAIRHANGTIEKVPVCQYPHYLRTGEIAVQGFPPATGPLPCSPWIECAETIAANTNSVSYGKLTATWTVPSEPTSKDGQDVAFFPGFEQTVGPTTVLQPVLAWNASQGGWYIEGENCCPEGNDFHGLIKTVKPLDKIQGQVQQTCSAGTISCPTWHVVVVDVTSGVKSSLPSDEGTSDGHTFDWAFAGAVEVAGLVKCADYPLKGQLILSGISLYDNNLAQISSPNWTAYINPAITPQCGYVVQSAQTHVTFDYLPTVKLTPSGTVQVSTTPPPYSAVLVDGNLCSPRSPKDSICTQGIDADVTVTLHRQVTAQCGVCVNPGEHPPCVIFDRSENVVVPQGQTTATFSDYAGRNPACTSSPITTEWTITGAVMDPSVALNLNLVPPAQLTLSAVF
jgi:hypothetical protein